MTIDDHHLPNSQCSRIEVKTSILMGKDPTVMKHIMVGVEEQAKEY